MIKLFLSLCAAAAVGAAASFGTSLGFGLMVSMPVIVMAQTRRSDAFWVASAYYAAASWCILPAARNFFGPNAGIAEALALWSAAALMLSTPWLLLWTPNLLQLLWRIPVALAASAVPPLAIIGWASPLTAAGILLPSTGWAGLIATGVIPAWFLIEPRRAAPVTLASCLVANMLAPPIPPPPAGWEAVDTNFGGVAHGDSSVLAEFAAAEWIKANALDSTARVIVFPETVVPMWTEATEQFWQPTLAQLRANGKVIVIGVGIPTGTAGNELSYLNTAIARGSQSATFQQRIPVPLGMWKPLGPGGVPLNLAGPAVLPIVGERAAILICYEQLLLWPIILSQSKRPSVLVAIANDHWNVGHSIARIRQAAISAWSRLFNIPYLTATNS